MEVIKMDKLQEIKNRYWSNIHVFYGELQYKGAGKIVFHTKESARDDIGWLIQTVEQQQKELDAWRKEFMY
jgi:hypothetical protein